MRISAKAEYACVAMLELAASWGEPQPVRVKAIAEAHGIDQRFLVQILLQLKTAGLVASLRGASGGYRLARPPAEISLAHVFNAVAREPTPHPALSTATPAVRAVHSVWDELHAREQRFLHELTLEELVRRLRESHELSYQI
ncbi:MAG TPA: Rrf2 family transcriptional regulator [Gemmataceae bacterium]|nr:Rrf2 family transcriptional regulator [Gemmataceae bacterium]